MGTHSTLQWLLLLLSSTAFAAEGTGGGSSSRTNPSSSSSSSSRSRSSGMPRHAHLQRGSVQTGVMERSEGHRKLLPTGTSETTVQLFLIGLAEPSQVDELRGRMSSMGGGAQVFSYIPDAHFLVLASLLQVVTLQEQMGVTAAPMPPGHKVALEVDNVLAAATAIVNAQLTTQGNFDFTSSGSVATAKSSTTSTTSTASTTSTGTSFDTTTASKDGASVKVSGKASSKSTSDTTTASKDDTTGTTSGTTSDTTSDTTTGTTTGKANKLSSSGASRSRAGAVASAGWVDAEALAQSMDFTSESLTGLTGLTTTATGLTTATTSTTTGTITGIISGSGSDSTQGAYWAVDEAVQLMKKAVHVDGDVADDTLSASLLVLLVTASESASLAPQLVPSWQRDLSVLLDSSTVSVKATAPSLVLVKAAPKDLATVTAWLSLQPLVAWIQPQIDSYTTNLFASSLMQSGSVKAGEGSYDPRTMDKHPFWAAGLDGTGQVVALVDTGVSMASCYINDPAVDFLSNVKNNSEGVAVFTSTTHRKVVQYYAYKTLYDEGGHGTHCGTTIAGSPVLPGGGSTYQYSNATGMAPGAKLAIFDVQDAAMTKSNSLDIPTDRGAFFYDVNYKSGARIQSNSWGEGTTSYTLTSLYLDQYLWNHPDFISLQAAGNGGEVQISVSATTVDGPITNGTVSSPANAKNVLAVGATESWSDKNLPRSLVQVSFTVLAPSGSGWRTVASLNGLDVSEWPIAGTAEGLAGKSMQIALLDPTRACTDPTNIGSALSGMAALFIRGTCTFSEKADTITRAAPLLGVMINTEQGELSASSMVVSNPNTKTVPVITLTLDVGITLYNYLQQGMVVFISVDSYTNIAKMDAYDNIASFSSFGPTLDGRVKPDLVAPGVLLSGFTNYVIGGDNNFDNDKCSATAILSGTSMATPVVSGAAALVRQYFRDGFLGGGKKGSGTSFTPSGILIKAILLVGTVDMQGYSFATNQKLAPAPSAYQGFGRMDLSRSLPLLGDKLGWKLQIIDMVVIGSQMEMMYRVYCTGLGPLSVVLVWNDYQAYPGTRAQLVNDLDLLVTGPVGALGQESVWAGNMKPGSSSQTDVVNTVEKVYIASPQAGTHTIRVRSKIINGRSTEQPFQFFCIAALGGLDQSGRLASSSASSSSVSDTVTDIVTDIVGTKNPPPNPPPQPPPVTSDVGAKPPPTSPPPRRRKKNNNHRRV